MHQKGNFVIAIVVIVAVLAGGYWLLRNKAQAPVEETATTTPVTIGFVGPLSGDAASYGESIKKGVELAKKELDPNNQINVLYEDSTCDPIASVNAVTKLATVDKVSAIIGDVCSGATLAAAPVAEQNAIVLISPSSTSEKVTSAGQFIFRTIPSDMLQGDFAAKLVSDKGYKKLAILYGNEEYGVGFNKILTDNFTTLGGKVVASESFENNATDLRTQITKIKSKSPDALFIVSNSPSSAVAALKQVSQLKMKVALFGSEGLKSPEILSGAGDLAEGLMVTSVTAGTPEFTEKYKAAYGEEPGPFAAQAYDAFRAIATAIQNGAKTGDEIRTQIATMEFSGASGLIKFDTNGDVSENYQVYVVSKHQFYLPEALEAMKAASTTEATTTPGKKPAL